MGSSTDNYKLFTFYNYFHGYRKLFPEFYYDFIFSLCLYYTSEPRTTVVCQVTLPCRVHNKIGIIQWTRDGFGLGDTRDLSGYSRYKLIGSDDESK